MRFAVAALVLLLLAGCAPGTDRASLQSRGDTLVAQLREVPGVLDAVVRDEKPGKNAAPMFVRVEYDLGAEGIAETLVAVRNTMSDSDFELFSLKAEVDDSQELPYGAEISWSGLPTEAAIREETSLMFALLESTPLLGMTYLASYSGVGSDVVVEYSRAVEPDGSLATADEVEAALTAAWVAAGRDADALGVLP